MMANWYNSKITGGEWLSMRDSGSRSGNWMRRSVSSGTPANNRTVTAGEEKARQNKVVRAVAEAVAAFCGY